LFYPVRYWVQPTLKGRWLHRDLNGMMWGSVRASLEAADHSLFLYSINWRCLFDRKFSHRSIKQKSSKIM
jgi:hypothetical protein